MRKKNQHHNETYADGGGTKFKENPCYIHSNNSYDHRGIQTRELLDSVLRQPFSSTSRDSLEKSLSNAVENLTWQIETPIKPTEIGFMRSFVTLYKDTSNSAGNFYDEIKRLEDSVMQSGISDKSKETILTCISITRNMYYDINSNKFFVKDINGNEYPMQRPAYTQCLDDQLSLIFQSDGNPIPEIAFIACLPESWLTITAYCAWDVLIGIPDIPLGNVIYVVNQ